MSVISATDFYKVSHHKMYPENTLEIYSNLTPRKSRLKNVKEVVVFGIQYFILEYLINRWQEDFFSQRKNVAIARYKRLMDFTMGKDSVSVAHLEELHDLGFLPLRIKALPEGTLCPIGVPCVTIRSTNKEKGIFGWLVNYLETIMSCTTWQPMTSATIARQYRLLLEKYAKETTGSTEFVQWQGHDFSMRGMSSYESACTSGAAHLLSFTGTDTIPAIEFLETYYRANVEKELVGGSVPATEHSVMCMGTKEDEIGTFKRLFKLYPAGILSIVSDTWDLWKVCTEYLPALKKEVLKRGQYIHKQSGQEFVPYEDEETGKEGFYSRVTGKRYTSEQIKPLIKEGAIQVIPGKVVIRPDSGDPVDIICGNNNILEYSTENEPIRKGVIELLWDTFGGKVNEHGYKELDPHIGAIYGDSITLERAEAICERLKAKGFASTNIVFGIGSYTYQYNTRDTFGFAVKATSGVVESVKETVTHDEEGDPYHTLIRLPERRSIFKKPVTDSGEKTSAKGLLRVDSINGVLTLKQDVTEEEEQGGELITVFEDGKLVKEYGLQEIRNRLYGK